MLMGKPWMFVVQEGQVQEIDLLAKGSGLERPDFTRKILAQGLMVERWLQAQGLTSLMNDAASKASEAKASTSRTEQLLSQQTLPAGMSMVEVNGPAQNAPPSKPKKPSRAKSKAQADGLEDVPPSLLPSINETASSSPAARVADTERPAAAPATKPLTVEQLGALSPAELAALPDHLKPNPFDALNDDPPATDPDDLDAFADSLLESV